MLEVRLEFGNFEYFTLVKHCFNFIVYKYINVVVVVVVWDYNVLVA